MEKNNIIKIILFNTLLILTIVFIFLLLFPKKSYVESKINQEEKTKFVVYDETFKNNFIGMKIASINFFEQNEKNKVTLKELIDEQLISELKSSNGESCSTESYAEKNDETMTINLICGDIKKNAEIDLKTYEENKKNKLVCIYEYQKTIEPTYTEWSEWSEWQTEKVEKDDLTNVETKIESTGDKTETISKPAIENKKTICPEGYIEENSQCKIKTKLNKTSASVAYNCPSGYKKNGTKCYSDTSSIDASKNYYCPTGDKYIEYELTGSECTAYRISYTEKTKEEKYYTCESGYELSENMCYKTIETEEENNKETTYYRFQKRNQTEEKIDIKWSTINDKELLNQEYNMVREITCEF